MGTRNGTSIQKKNISNKLKSVNVCSRRIICLSFLDYYLQKEDMVPGAGIEPAQPQGPRDFKSIISNFPPFPYPTFYILIY